MRDLTSKILVGTKHAFFKRQNNKNFSFKCAVRFSLPCKPLFTRLAGHQKRLAIKSWGNMHYPMRFTTSFIGHFFTVSHKDYFLVVTKISNYNGNINNIIVLSNSQIGHYGKPHTPPR